ncbi:MAG: hypothetical protein JSS82_08040 [Bacteroidetes bacterium]|nr:hypothetical protein [Bacteroidota bacterium]
MTESLKRKNAVLNAIVKLRPDPNRVAYLVPHYLTTDEFKATKPNYCELEEWESACYYVAGTIDNKAFDFTTNDKLDVIGKPMYSKTLKAILGSRYPRLIKSMIKAKIIIRTNDYSHGSENSHARMYVLGEKLLNNEPEFRPIKYPAIKKRLIRWKTDHWNKQRERLLKLGDLVYWAIHPGLQIDKKGALNSIDQIEALYHKKLAELPPGSKRDKLLKNLKYRLAHCKTVINNWEKFKIEKLKVDDAGRFYSILSNLPSPVRHFVKFQGERLVSIDIRNSQPLHAAIMLDKEFWITPKDRITIKTLLEKTEDLPSRKGTAMSATELSKMAKAGRQLIINLQKAKKTTDNQSVSFSFKEVVESGFLYEYLSNRYTANFKSVTREKFSKRAGSKRQLMIIFYGRSNGVKVDREVLVYFKSLFPDLAKVMEFLKQQHYKDFAFILQRLEAFLLLHTLCPRIAKYYRKLPYFTIHDSIITFKSARTLVENLLVKVYQPYLHFKIKYKLEKMGMLDYWLTVGEYVESKIFIGFGEVRKKVPSTGRRLKKRPSFENIDNLITAAVNNMWDFNYLPFEYQIGPQQWSYQPLNTQQREGQQAV